MEIVHDVFEKPLRKSKMIPDNQIDEIFINWKDIISCNRDFLYELMANESDTVGDVICRHVSRFFSNRNGF